MTSTTVAEEYAASSTVPNYLESYRRRCAEEGCRANSAVVALFQSNPTRPLQSLPLANNYVGPKGFLAVLHIVEQCQTMESIDLRGNGLDNTAVALLCRVLDRHLGVSRLHLDSNPISMDAGHCLMALLEKNRNIVECTVQHTDIFSGVADRITEAAAANHERVLGTRPQLAPAKPIFLRPMSRGGGHSGSDNSVTKRATLSNVAPVRPVTRHGHNSSDAENTSEPREQVASRAMQSDDSPTRSVAAAMGGPSLVAKRPKPPPPALASDSHAKLTADHRKELRERYRRRAEQYIQDTERTASAIAAEKARNELAALEAAQARLQAARDMESSSKIPRSEPRDNSPAAALHSPVEANSATPNGRAAARPRAARPGHGGGVTSNTASPRTKEDDMESTPLQYPELPAPVATKQTKFMIDGEEVRPERPSQSSYEDAPSASLQVEFGGSATVEPSDVAAATGQPAANLVVEPTDHFKVLFNLGCRHYNERNLDAAYQAWTEALTLASNERNREWMQLLTHNLQSLSYEVLMAETNKHIETNALDDADRTLALAERVAKRARNATWLADVAKSRQRVLRGQFQRHHEAAQERYEALQRYQTVQVTDDDRYEEDGVLMQHSELYVNEWARMLLMKEAIEGWAEAFQCAKEVGGQQGRAMQEVVDTAVQALCVHMTDRYFHFGDQGPSELTSHNTWGLTANERAKMADLWMDITSKSKVLEHQRWDYIQAAQVGNLHFASHDLNRAMEQFKRMATLAQQLDDRFFLAVAQYCIGSLHHQRSSYADAETALRYAVELLIEVRREMPDPTRERMNATDAGSPAASIDMSIPGSAALRSPGLSAPTSAAHVRSPSAGSASDIDAARQVSVGQLAAANLHYRAYYLLSRNLVESFKFAEALEMHERSLVAAHCDVLHEKLMKNFHNATRDHIMCVASTMQSPLVYLAIHYRHEWNVESETYTALERLYVWIVPSETDSKFLLVDVEKDHKVRSILHLIDQARRAMSVQTNSEDTAVDPIASNASQNEADSRSPPSREKPMDSMNGVQLQVPALQWRTPLHRLFRVLLRPVIDTIAAYSQYTNANGFVVIPHGFLWLVPYSALIDDADRFVIENFTITHGLCATQLAYSALAWKSAGDNGSERRMVISQTDAQPASIEPHLAFLSDSHRADQEAQEIAAALRAELITGTSTDAIKIPSVLPKSRLIHVSTPVVSDAGRGQMTGGIAATTSFDHLGILHTADVAFSRIRAELAFHTNVNVARNSSFLSPGREGSLGWMRAMLGCGVACCVFPLWCTPDMMPVDFAKAFYTEMEKCGNHKSRAAANTMRAMLADTSSPTSNPRIWAPFVVLGFPQPLPAKRAVQAAPKTSDTAATTERRHTATPRAGD